MKKKKKNKNKYSKSFVIIIGIIAIVLLKYLGLEDIYQEIPIANNTSDINIASTNANIYSTNVTDNSTSEEETTSISDIPEYSGNIYITINNNVPEFTADDLNLEDVSYSELTNGRVRSCNDKNKLDQSNSR